MPALVLIHPDIPQNLGGILRLGACLRLPLHIIEPCGFPLDDNRMRRAGMDYIQHAEYRRHASWERFLSAIQSKVALLSLATASAEQVQENAEIFRSDSDHEVRGVRGGATAPPANTLPARLVLIETDGTASLDNFAFQPDDYIIFGSESAGTPRALYADMDITLRIPMQPAMRSLNLAISAGMVAFEAYRQLRWEL